MNMRGEVVGYVGTGGTVSQQKVLGLLHWVHRQGGFLQDGIPTFTLMADMVVER